MAGEGTTRMNEGTMNCAEFEGLLAEALDGALAGAARARFDEHRAGCADCGPLYADAAAGLAWMKSLDEVEPPRNLVRNVLIATSGQEAEADAAGEASSGWMRGWLRPTLFPLYATVRQPRFAMSAAMAFFSVSLMMQVTGVKLSDLRLVDLRPSTIQSSAVRGYSETSSRVVKYYENIRLVYEIQTRMQELKDAARPEPQAQPSAPKKDDKKNNDTSGQPDQEKERQYSRESRELVLASARAQQGIRGGTLASNPRSKA
jgi:hypothetical protein